MNSSQKHWKLWCLKVSQATEYVYMSVHSVTDHGWLRPVDQTRKHPVE